MGSSRQIRTIVFDMVGTLAYPTPSVPDIYTEVAHRFGSKQSKKDIQKRFLEAFRHESQLDEQRGFTTNENHERARWQRIVSSSLCDVSDAASCFNELYQHFANPDSWSLYPDALPVIKDLLNKDYLLVIASNFDHRLRHICQHHPVLCDLVVTVASEAGYLKPDIHFFRHVETKTKTSASNLLLVGDDYLHDYQGASRAGWHALHLCRDATREPESETDNSILTLETLVDYL